MKVCAGGAGCGMVLLPYIVPAAVLLRPDWPRSPGCAYWWALPEGCCAGFTGLLSLNALDCNRNSEQWGVRASGSAQCDYVMQLRPQNLYHKI